MAGIVGHLFVDRDQAVLLDVIVELRAGERMAERNLNGLDVEFLGEIDALPNGLARFARQSHDEIAMDRQAELLAVRGEAASHVDGGALLDVLQDLLIAGFVADDEQPATGFLHGFQRVVIGGDARRATPGKFQLLQLAAQLNRARLLVIEGVVVEEDLLEAGKVFESPAALVHDIVGRTQAPAMARVGLRPEAERALSRTAARRVERDIRIQQKRDVIAPEIQIALINL